MCQLHINIRNKINKSVREVFIPRPYIWNIVDDLENNNSLTWSYHTSKNKLKTSKLVFDYDYNNNFVVITLFVNTRKKDTQTYYISFFSTKIIDLILLGIWTAWYDAATGRIPKVLK